MKTLTFLKNANNKLSNIAFSVFRPSDGNYKAGDHVKVMLSEGQRLSSYGIHKIESIEEIAIHEITDAEARLESGMKANDLIHALKKRYKGEKEYDYMILVKIEQEQSNEPNAGKSPHQSPEGGSAKSNLQRSDNQESAVPITCVSMV